MSVDRSLKSQPKIRRVDGGDTQEIVAGGKIAVRAGAVVEIGGVDRTDALASAPAGVAAGYKVARGQHTTVTAEDTIATGLATVVTIVASLDSDPGDDPLMVSATVGNQDDAPVAGSVIIKTWATNGTDPTPVAATTFAKKVNWIAIGT